MYWNQGNAREATICLLPGSLVPLSHKPTDWVLSFQQGDEAPPVSFFTVLRLNSAEWPYIFIGIICAAINGAIQPLFAVIFSKIITVSDFTASTGKNSLRHSFLEQHTSFPHSRSQVFIEPDDVIRERTSVFSLMFVGIGCVSFVTMFLQVGVYSALSHTDFFVVFHYL